VKSALPWRKQCERKEKGKREKGLFSIAGVVGLKVSGEKNGISTLEGKGSVF